MKTLQNLFLLTLTATLLMACGGEKPKCDASVRPELASSALSSTLPPESYINATLYERLNNLDLLVQATDEDGIRT